MSLPAYKSDLHQKYLPKLAFCHHGKEVNTHSSTIKQSGNNQKLQKSFDNMNRKNRVFVKNRNIIASKKCRNRVLVSNIIKLTYTEIVQQKGPNES